MSAESYVVTPRTRKPRPPRSRCMALRLGISERQGTHQVAQKLSSTTCPRRAETLTGLPSSAFRLTSGAGAAAAVAGADADCAGAAEGFAGESCFKTFSALGR